MASNLLRLAAMPPSQLSPSPNISGDAAQVAALLRRRKRVRRMRFVVCETIALTVMVASVVAGVSERFASEAFTPVFRILPIAAAAVATVLPILFFGHRKRR